MSRQADYAVRLVFELAQRAPFTVQVKDVAERHGISSAYLQKVVQRLVQAGLVRTLRGPHGGVRLSRRPDQVTLREVVEAVDGPVVFNRCQLWPGECSDNGPCPTHDVWERLSKHLTQAMEEVTFASLVESKYLGNADASKQEAIEAGGPSEI